MISCFYLHFLKYNWVQLERKEIDQNGQYHMWDLKVHSKIATKGQRQHNWIVCPQNWVCGMMGSGWKRQFYGKLMKERVDACGTGMKNILNPTMNWYWYSHYLNKNILNMERSTFYCLEISEEKNFCQKSEMRVAKLSISYLWL